MTPTYIYRAVIRSIYDGDTIRADIDLGLSTWAHGEPLRLLGIDAPELRGDERALGLAARDWLAGMIPAGTPVIVRTVRDRTEKYGRYLAVVYVERDGAWTDVNEALIAAGHAMPYMVD